MFYQRWVNRGIIKADNEWRNERICHPQNRVLDEALDRAQRAAANTVACRE